MNTRCIFHTPGSIFFYIQYPLIKKLNWKKVYIGIIAGIITVIIFKIDRLEFFSTMYHGVLSYSVSLPVLFLIGIMSFIGGLTREYKACLTYILTMILYDLITNDIATVLFAGISSIMLTIGALTSTIASWIQDVT